MKCSSNETNDKRCMQGLQTFITLRNGGCFGRSVSAAIFTNFFAGKPEQWSELPEYRYRMRLF